MSVLSHLTDLASDLNLVMKTEEYKKITGSKETIMSRASSYFSSDTYEGSLLFGSTVRETLLPRSADATSDVDIMLLFKNPNGFRPQAFYDRIKKFADKYYRSSEVYRSSPTVVLELSHIKFDLVPAYKSSGFTYIPAPSNHFQSWMTTDPLGFNTTFETKNKNENYNIRRLCRLMKYWNARKGEVYDAFALEQKIVSMFFFNCNNLQDYFFTCVSNLSPYDFLGTKWKLEAIKDLQTRCTAVKDYIAKGMPATAETELKKILPVL